MAVARNGVAERKYGESRVQVPRRESHNVRIVAMASSNSATGLARLYTVGFIAFAFSDTDTEDGATPGK